MDRNQIIGFALLALLVIGYFSYNAHEQKLYQEQKHTDSIAYAKVHPRPVVDSSKAVTAATAPIASNDSATEALKKLQPSSYYGQAQQVKLENKKLAIQFST